MGPEKIRNDKVDRKWQNNAYEKGICGRRVLIEPYWNVKDYSAEIKVMTDKSINRTILECKADNAFQNNQNLPRINRTILECKDTGDIHS